jgi:hypothetical protein
MVILHYYVFIMSKWYDRVLILYIPWLSRYLPTALGPEICRLSKDSLRDRCALNTKESMFRGDAFLSCVLTQEAGGGGRLYA